ncbi:hypothetical protein DYY67_0694 [Candidatus Nitrosotalea sp. TS]|nr:hypothetical protein [Candidatus Nitrosotalea sp. TS]
MRVKTCDHFGLKFASRSQTWIHYNFIREHGSIKKTPTEEVGIRLNLGQNKIETLSNLPHETALNNVINIIFIHDFHI